jgi:hypothetical protein
MMGKETVEPLALSHVTSKDAMGLWHWVLAFLGWVAKLCLGSWQRVFRQSISPHSFPNHRFPHEKKKKRTPKRWKQAKDHNSKTRVQTNTMPRGHPWKKGRMQKRHASQMCKYPALSTMPFPSTFVIISTLMQPFREQIKLIYFIHCLSCIFK